MAAIKLLGVLLQICGRLHWSSAKSVLKCVVKELPKRPFGNRLMHPSLLRVQVELELQCAVDRAEVGINNSESSHKREISRTDQTVVPNRWLMALHPMDSQSISNSGKESESLCRQEEA